MTAFTVRPNKRRFAIALYLLSGWTAWGVHLDRGAPTLQPRLVVVDRRWIMCCGHVLLAREIAAWKADGLLQDGAPDARGDLTVVAGPRLEYWVTRAWDGLAARTWGAS